MLEGQVSLTPCKVGLGPQAGSVSSYIYENKQLPPKTLRLQNHTSISFNDHLGQSESFWEVTSEQFFEDN